MVTGYNIALKLGGKTVAGRTQEDLSISAITKESITKDDAGVKNKIVTGHNVTFKVSALVDVESTTKLTRDAVIAYALAKGSSAVVAFEYTCAGGKSLTGNCIITGYSESSAADPDSDTTLSLDAEVTGDVTIVTPTS